MDWRGSLLEIIALLLFITLGSAISECSSNPCHDGATCLGGPYEYYTCLCPNGWHGKNCDTKLPEDYHICSSGNIYNYTGEKTAFRQSTGGSVHNNECFYLIRIHGADTINITFQECSLLGEGDGLFFGWGNEIPTSDHFEKELCHGESNHTLVPDHWSFNGSAAWIRVQMIESNSSGYRFTFSADGNDCKQSPCFNNGSCSDLIRDFHCDCTSGYQGKQCDDPVSLPISVVASASICAVLALVCLYILLWWLFRRKKQSSSVRLPTSQRSPGMAPHPSLRFPGIAPHPSQSGEARPHNEAALNLPHRERTPGQFRYYEVKTPSRKEPLGRIGVSVPRISTVSSRVSICPPQFDNCPREIDDLTCYLIAESMNSDTDVYHLGVILELPIPRIRRHIQSNFTSSNVNTSGTVQMLRDWHARTFPINRWETLYKALLEANLSEGMRILTQRAREMAQRASHQE